MAIPVVLRRSYMKIKNNGLSPSNNVKTSFCWFGFSSRKYSDNNNIHGAEFINSTILIENGFNVQELPVVVRKIKDFAEVVEKPLTEVVHSTPDSQDYHLIKEEFKQCMDLRDVFSLLSKCTKITPNIALGAMERIYELEKYPLATATAIPTATLHVNVAKGAILDKLLKVVMKTEDTQTILNILNSDSSFMEPYKYKFCDELLLRVIDNQLSIEQLCEFITFLIENKTDNKYSDMIDKLWVGFIDKEQETNETNIASIFKILPALKTSKKTILALMEQKLANLWYNIQAPAMQDILNIFLQEKYLSMQSFAVVGRWYYANLHALDEDMMLDIVTKFTRLKYTDDVVEKAVEKYMKLKGAKIESQILIVGILNYCMQFQIRNEIVLEACSEYFINNGTLVPNSFLMSFIYPFGYLCYNPTNPEFWHITENIVIEKFDKISSGDICSIVLSFLYSGIYPMTLVRRLFSAEYLIRIHNTDTLRKLHLIDTALALECKDYAGPLMPKDQWPKTISQDARVRNIIEKIKDSLVLLAGGTEKISIAVLIPFLYADETYLIDIMLHPVGLGTDAFNWKLKSGKNENTALLIHLPDHFCADGNQLIGPQVMRHKHLKLLGLKVACVKYSILSQFYVSHKKLDLENYINDCIINAEGC